MKRSSIPLPWSCEHQGSDTDFCIVGAKEADGSYPLVAIVMSQLGEINRLGNIKTAQSKNGDFIVRACNSHDELMAACKSYLDHAKAGDSTLDCFKQIEAAYAKAEGHGA